MRTSTARAAVNAVPLRLARMVLLNCMVGFVRKTEWEGRGGEKTANSEKKEREKRKRGKKEGGKGLFVSRIVRDG